MDPTEGILSLFIMAALRYMRQIISASNSREHEEQADELGLKLAAMSCFDTRKGSKVMASLHEIKEAAEVPDQIDSTSTKSNDKLKDDHNSDSKKDKDGYVLSSLIDSHPPTMLRYENLLKLSKEENPNKYSSRCNNTRRKFLRALKMID